jgi:hypothetical protein
MVSTGHNKSTLAVVVDLRKYLPAASSDDDYLGNLVMSVRPTWTLKERGNEIEKVGKVVPLQDTPESRSLPPVMSVPVSPSSSSLSLQELAHLAMKITKSIYSVSPSWISTRLNDTLTLPFDQTSHGRLRFSNGPDLYITSWQHMGAGR